MKSSAEESVPYKVSNDRSVGTPPDAMKLGKFWLNPIDFGLEAEAISPQEILEATQEMLARLEGRFKYSPESERLIQAYNKLWNELGGPTRAQCKTPIGIAWLKKNQQLYL